MQRGAHGDTIAQFVGTSLPPAVTDEEWDSAGAELRDYLKADRGAKRNQPSLTRPSQKTVLRSFVWDSEGRLWVEHFARVGFAFDVFDSTGRQIATLSAPDRDAEIEPHVHHDRLVLVGASAEGAHVIRAYRVVAPR